ncbi:MAG TPA: YfcE family phosphodiesterase [Gaiellaceae bacterium]|nr:YfcE family phosphodiesterase [Gaiellaceae bacterium]
MRVAALYDVHGNLPALEAVLVDLEREGVDAIVFGGDLTWGPLPAETLSLARSIERARFVRGNCDRDPDEWERSCLAEEEVAFLQTLPVTLELDGVLYCHATPRSDEEVVTPATSDERLAAILAGVEQQTVVAGHTHMQQDRRLPDVRFVNAGSVGLPYEGEVAAFWALLADGDVELRMTPVDRGRIERMLRESRWPPAPEILRENVLQVVSREQAIAELEGSAHATLVTPPE